MVTKYNFSSIKNNYLTPPSLIQQGIALLALHKGKIAPEQFDLDVCCSNTNVPAKEYYMYPEHNGLVENWKQYNWCNPPYNECQQWVKKAYAEQLKGNTSVLLIPVRTETAYWHKYILYNENTEIYWLRKGYKFLDPDTKKEMGVFKNALALVLFKGINNE